MTSLKSIFQKILCASLLFLGPSSIHSTEKKDLLLFVGTLTQTKSKGIHLFKLNPSTGSLTSLGLVAETRNPSFLAFHPHQPILYTTGSATDDPKGKKPGMVISFKIQPAENNLVRLNEKPSGGIGPCHLSVDASGKSVLVANYGGGTVSSIPIQENGSLGDGGNTLQHEGSSIHPRWQKKPHPHSINLDPTGIFAFVTDLGIDKILTYKFKPLTSTLVAHDPPGITTQPGAGPRHLAFHPSGKFAYVIHEIQCSVTGYSCDAGQGLLREIQTLSTLPREFHEDDSAAEIQVHPSGKFLYASTRGPDSIAAFSVNPENGRLTPMEHEPTQGKTPRHFGITPDGNLLVAANQDSDTLVVFRIDPSSGKLEPTGHSIECPTPVCVKFFDR